MVVNEARTLIEERVQSLPSAVRDCEACGSTETMQIRRSSLRPSPCADDVTLKCSECRRIRTHGIPVTRVTYESELDMRDSRTLDYVADGPDDRNSNLKALGYIED